MIIFNNTSAEIETKSADVSLKMIIILKELRIAQMNELFDENTFFMSYITTFGL